MVSIMWAANPNRSPQPKVHEQLKKEVKRNAKTLRKQSTETLVLGHYMEGRLAKNYNMVIRKYSHPVNTQHHPS
jgi:hypothetical protein